MPPTIRVSGRPLTDDIPQSNRDGIRVFNSSPVSMVHIQKNNVSLTTLTLRQVAFINATKIFEFLPKFLAADNVSRFVVSGISLLSNSAVDDKAVVGSDEVVAVVVGFEVVVVVVVVLLVVVVVIIGFVGLYVA